MSPLLLFKFGSRARSTSIGIALCTMFILASFSVVGGLKSSMDRLEGNFAPEFYLVTKPSSSGPSFFEPSALLGILDNCAYGSFVHVVIDSDRPATLFSMSDNGNLFPTVAKPTGSEVYVQSGDLGTFNVTSPSATESVAVAGILNHDLFPGDWILASRDIVDELSDEPGLANFAVIDALSEEQRDRLAIDGFSIQSTIGIIDFLGQSVEQIQGDVIIVLIPSSFVIAVLSYGFVGCETADRRHDIGILKTIGAGRARILRSLFANALLVSLWGGALGVALGIVLSYALSTAVSTVFTSVFIMGVDLWLVGIAFLVTVVSSAAGALVPALRMTMSSPVDDLKGATR